MPEVIGTHSSDGRPMVLVETRAEWRAWLEENHGSTGAWLVSWKKATGRPFIPYPETVDEALCFGWVDSRPNRLDEERAMRLFTPRKPKSPWSRLNKEKVARLSTQGLMAPAGMRMVATAQANGSWTVYDEIEDLVIPPDLAAALAEDRAAQWFFERFAESSKKAILWWIKAAKRPETRAARIAETVRAAAQNRMADHFAGRDAGV
ncbi:MAG: YdeI/OmpD-associated family protein [Chloroflexota bacterium]|nr:YdeI/OmpD-associated family protein [Chloroflexota bacterium]MDE2885008.1 YdeI/OmpD-associated family protein [Chloroflexota bacterium]